MWVPHIGNESHKKWWDPPEFLSIVECMLETVLERVFLVFLILHIAMLPMTALSLLSLGNNKQPFQIMLIILVLHDST